MDDFKLADLLPRVLPGSYTEYRLEPRILAGWPRGQIRRWDRGVGGLRVIVSVDSNRDGAGAWLHASVSYPDRLPTWDDLKEVHEAFMGDRPAIQLLPPRAYWINHHPFTLHLFARLDQDTVPPALWRD